MRLTIHSHLNHDVLTERVHRFDEWTGQVVQIAFILKQIFPGVAWSKNVYIYEVETPDKDTMNWFIRQFDLYIAITE